MQRIFVAGAALIRVLRHAVTGATVAPLVARVRRIPFHDGPKPARLFIPGFRDLAIPLSYRLHNRNRCTYPMANN